MAKRKADIVKVGTALPTFMTDESILGIEGLSEYVSPPRIRLVQSMSKALLEDFCLGDCVVVPNNIMLSEMVRDGKGKPTGENLGFVFTPILFYVEYVTWNPVGVIPAIVERTVNRDHPIALKAQNPKLRTETTTDGETRHVEHLNFIVMLEDDRITDPCIMSFARAEHKAGRALASLITMRRGPIYGMRFNAQIGLRENDQGQWWGFDITNPSENPWVDEKSFTILKGLHLKAVQLTKDSRIRANYEGEEAVSTEDKF